MILEAYAMICFLEESCVAPDPFLKDSSGNFTRESNLEFVNWRSREQALFTFINSTLSPSVLAITMGQKSAKGVRNVLEKRFAFVSRSHVLSLRNELLSIKKGPESMDNFFQRIKEARDRLSVVAVFVDEEELIHLVLEALPHEYSAFCSAIRTRNDVVTIEELNTLLNAEERALKKKSEIRDTARDTAMAMILQSGFNQNHNRGRGRNGNQRGRGRGFNHFSPNFGPNFGFNHGQSSGHSSGNANGILQFPGFQPQSQHKNGSGFPSFQSQGQSQSSRPTCQICGKNGHTALDCYHRMNFAYQGKHALAKLASMVATANSASANASSWLTNTGCSDHVTPDLSQLSLTSQAIAGHETVTVGNGQELPVTHIGNGKLQTPSHCFRLDNILRVPD